MSHTFVSSQFDSSPSSPSHSGNESQSTRNPTGVYLDDTSNAITITLSNGKQGIQGVSFLDRLLPASVSTAAKQPPPGSTTHNVMNKRGAARSGPLSALNTPCGGCLSNSFTDDTLNNNMMMNNSSFSTVNSSMGGKGVSLSSPSLPLRSSTQSGYADADDDGDDAAGGRSGVDSFFERMRCNLKEMRYLNTATLRQREAARVATLRGSGVSSSATLHPLIHTEPKKRDQLNQLFGRLQQPAIKDTVRPEVQRRLDYQSTKYHQNVNLILEPAKGLLEAVWDQHRVSQAERSQFAEQFFSLDLGSYDAIARELQRYHKVPLTDVELIRMAGLRETYISRLKTLMESSLLHRVGSSSSSGEGTTSNGNSSNGSSLLSRPMSSSSSSSTSSSFSMNASAGSSSRKATAAIADSSADMMRAEGFVMEVFNCILLLRHVTCAIVDLIHARRNQTGDPNESNKVFLWNGKNYLIEIQSDLNWLADTKMTYLLGDGFVLVNNPLLLPVALHEQVLSVVSGLQRREMSVQEALNASFVAKQKVTTVDEEASSRHGEGGLPVSMARPSSQQSSRAVVPLALPNGRPSSTNSVRSAVVATPVPRKFRGPVVCIKEGEEVQLIKQPSTPITANLSAPVDAQQTTEKNSATEKREKYFEKLKKEELLRTRKIDMDRSNVYQYPASVYKEASPPRWVELSRMLRRSLDPRLVIPPYDDVKEFVEHKMLFVMPPSIHHPWMNPVVDKDLQCFRTVLSDLPAYSYDSFMRREVLIFAESHLIRKADVKKRMHRALDRLKMTYRGFISGLRRRREHHQHTDHSRMAQEFIEWVKQHCPDWTNEVRAALGSSAEDDDADDNAAMVGFLAADTGDV